MAAEQVDEVGQSLLFKEMLDSAESLRAVGELDAPRLHLGLTPLAWACHRSDAKAAKRLLGLGANPRALSKDGRTPMELAARAVVDGEGYFKRENWAACVELLLGAGIDVNEQPCLIECGVMSCRIEGPWMFEWLLSKGARASASKEQKELLAGALRHGRSDAVRLLLIAGVDVSGIDVSAEVRAGQEGGIMIKEVQDVAAERKVLSRETPQAETGRAQSPRL